MKIKRYLRLISAILLMALGVGFVFVFEMYGKEKLDTVEIVVAKNTIEFKQLITNNDIEIRNIRRGSDVDEAYSGVMAETLVGKYASVKIQKGTQLYPELIDTYNLVPDETKGEFVAPIPSQWIFAVPGSLRKTFIADIYLVGDKEQTKLQDLIKDAKDMEDDGSTYMGNNGIISTDVKPDFSPILTNVRVASVKDSGNKEVVESTESKQATGSVSSLEIIANDEILELIHDATNTGSKLYVVYKFERGLEEGEDVE